MSYIFNNAYCISNENQRWITSLFPNAKRVLTVAGSGDQALFYALNGAEQIDTYDITDAARVIQDIKTTALRHLKHDEYCELIYDLHMQKRDYKQTLHINKILPNLPPASKEILNKYGTNIGFSRGSFYREHLPSATEYARMQATITQPFNFIHTPLDKLHEKTNNKYDIINTSNIFDIGNPQEHIQIIKKLAPHLNVNGRILCIDVSPTPILKNLQIQDTKTGLSFGYENTYTNPQERFQKLISFQRTR